jgi:hypothetical protein
MKKAILILGTALALMPFTSCTTFVPNPPTAGPCTFTIREPANYACYINKAGTGRKIKLNINIVTQFINPNNTGPNYLDYDDKSITIDPSVTPFPITLTVNVPNSPNAYICQTNIQAVECSTCANTWSIPTEQPYGDCPTTTILNPPSPPSYLAALPRWNAPSSFQHYRPTETLNVATRIFNVPNSCGCTVQ